MKEYKFDDLKIGMVESFQKKIGNEEIRLFSKITGDENPLHLNLAYASQTQFRSPIVFGQLVNSYLSTLAGMYLPGKYSLIMAVESNFKKPCYANDLLTISGEVISKIEIGKMIILKTMITNQKSEVLQVGKMTIKLLK